MITKKVDPKYFYFRQATKVSNIYQCKSCLSETYFNRLEIIEEKFPEDMEINNPVSVSWITIYVNSL